MHFWQAAVKLKQITGDRVVVRVKPFLIPMLEKRAKADGIVLASAKEDPPESDATTHIISLLGELEMTPQEIADVGPLLPEAQALERVRNQVQPHVDNGKIVMALFLGEKRQATLIGGKQLPRDPKAHGREFDSEPFNALAYAHPELHIIDCGTQKSKMRVGAELEDRVEDLIPEAQPFDSIVAFAAYMNEHKQIVAFAADQGPPNVFSRGLDERGQQRMVFVIPNGQEYDMRMEGEGDHYTHMLTKACHIYKCATPDDQTEVVERAYTDLTELTHG